MKHFLFEDREYRMNPQFGRLKKQRDSAQGLAHLIRQFRGSSGRRKNAGFDKHSGGGGKRGGGASFGGDMRRQKCVVKMQYSLNIQAHKVQLEKYLTREGTGKDKIEGAELYGTDLEEYKANMVDKNFRIFLSPQNGEEVDLSALTKDFVRRLEMQTGYKLYWQAANHYNTAHPHSHLLINGVDQRGEKVEFSRDVVKTFMREAARDLCTAQAGLRTDAEIALEKDMELKAPRWTRNDEKLKQAVLEDGKVEFARLGREEGASRVRAAELCKIGVCSWHDGAYYVDEKWEENLRANGRYNCFLRAREELAKFRSEKTAELYSGETPALALYEGSAGKVTGRVIKIYRTDEDASDNHAVLLEGKDAAGNAKAFFVPLMKRPEARTGFKTKGVLREGDIVTLSAFKNQKGRLTPVFDRKPMWGGGDERTAGIRERERVLRPASNNRRGAKVHPNI